MIIGHIYGGIDADTREMRYVGKSIRPVGVRPAQHVKEALAQYKRTHKENWIRARHLAGQPIEWVVIEYHTSDDPRSIRDLETGWIKYFREIGCRLTNGTMGGEGCDTMSPETRKKISLANRGKKRGPVPFEVRKKISASTLGKPKSPETKAKIAIARTGISRPPISAESRLKLGAALKGKNSGKVPWNKGKKTGINNWANASEKGAGSLTKTFKALAFMLDGPPPPRPSACGEVGWAVHQSTPENERDWGSGSRHNNIVTRLWTAKLVEEKDGKQIISEKGMNYLKIRGYKPKVMP